MHGKEVLDHIQMLKEAGAKITEEKRDGYHRIYIKGDKLKVEITISPNDWLGFELQVESNGIYITYSSDTDLYDINHPEYSSLVKAVEDEIVRFLDALRDNEAKLGVIKRKTVLLFPASDGFTVITKGRFITKIQKLKNVDQLLSRGNFTSLEM